MERFWSKVVKSDGCWEWTGCHDRRGYGLFQYEGRSQIAHRVSWQMHFGPIPHTPGETRVTMLCVCHRCDNPRRVRPDHLWLGTNADNQADKQAKGRGVGGRTNKPRGDAHWRRLHPERANPARGAQLPQARLTEADALAIRKARASGTPGSALARQYGISPATVCDLVKGRTWAHLPLSEPA